MPANSFVQTLEIQAKDNASPALKSASQSAQQAAGSIDNSGKALASAGQAATQTQSKFSTFGKTLQSNAGSLTAVTGSAWGLFNAFDDMEKKVLGANRAQTMAERSALMLAKQQDKLAKIGREQGKGSAAYAQQLEVVRLAQDKATQTQEKAKIMAGDLQESYVQLAMTAGPMAAALGGSVAQMVGNFSKMGPAAGGAAQAVSGIAPAANKAGLAMKLLHFAMGPVGIILLAIGALFTLYATNAWGFADAVNGVAKSILDAIGGIAGAVQSAATRIGNFIGAFMKDILAGNIPAALNRIKTLILSIYTEWIKPTFDKIGAFIMDKLNIIASAFRDPIGTARTLITGLLDFIFKSFQAIAPAVIAALSTLNTAINDAVQAALDAFILFGETLLTLLTELFTVTIPDLLMELGELILTEVATWPDRIMEGLSTLADLIATEGPKWLEGIKTAFIELITWIGTEALKIGQKIADALGTIDWQGIWQSLQDAFWATLDWMYKEAVKAGNGIRQFFESIDWPGIWQSLQDAFWSSLDWIYQRAVEIGTGIRQLFESIDWNAVWQAMVTAFSTVVNTITSMFTWENIARGFKVASGFFTQIAQIFNDSVVKPIQGYFTWENIARGFKVASGFFAQVAQVFNDSVIKPIQGWFTWENIAKNFKSNAAGFAQIPQIFNDSVVKPIQGYFTWENIAKNFKSNTDFFSGIADAFQKNVVDPIIKAWDSLDFTKKAQDLGQQIVDGLNAAGKGLGDLLAFLNPLQPAFAEVEGGAEGLSFALKDVEEKAAPAAEKIATVTEAVKETETPVQRAIRNLQELKYKLETVPGAFQQLRDIGIVGLAELEKQGGHYMRKLAAAITQYGTDLVKSLDESNTKIEAHNQFWAHSSNPIHTYIDALQEAILANIDVAQSLEDANYAQFLYTEGQIAGTKSAKEFVDQLIENQGAYDAEKTALEGIIMGLGSLEQGFSGLPGFIEPTIENIRTWAAGMIMGGEAAEKARDMAVSAWESMTSAASSTFSSMIGVFTRSSEEMKTAAKDGVDAWNEEMKKLPAGVAEALPPGTIENLKLDAEFAAVGQKAAQAFAMTLQGNRNLGFDAAQKLAAGAASGLIQGFVDKHPEFADEAAVFFDAIKSGSATAVQGALDELSKMPGPFGDIFRQMKEAADTNLDGIPDILQKDVVTPMQGLEGPAGAAGSASGIALSQEFAAAGTHIAAVMKGIQATIDGLKQKQIPKLGVNIQNVMQNTSKAQQLITGVKQKTIPRMGVNIQNILQNTSRAQNAINSVRQRSIPRMGVNIQNVFSNVSRAQRAINSVRGRTVYIDVRQRLVGTRYAASGFHADVSQPMMIMVGEKGREKVTVEPISTANLPSGGGTRGGYGGGRGGGAGGQPAIFRGDVILDGHKVGRVMGRLIAENNV